MESKYNNHILNYAYCLRECFIHYDQWCYCTVTAKHPGSTHNQPRMKEHKLNQEIKLNATHLNMHLQFSHLLCHELM